MAVNRATSTKYEDQESGEEVLFISDAVLVDVSSDRKAMATEPQTQVWALRCGCRYRDRRLRTDHCVGSTSGDLVRRCDRISHATVSRGQRPLRYSTANKRSVVGLSRRSHYNT